MELNEITLDLRDDYKKLTEGIRMSFYSFTTIFMARNCTFYRYVDLGNGALAVLSTPPNKKPTMMCPLGTEEIMPAFQALHEKYGVEQIWPLTEEMKCRIETECGTCFTYEEVRDYEDYVYETEKMISLSGKPYHSKRNFISRFTSRYDFEYVELTQENIGICKPVMEKWFAEHPQFQNQVYDEKGAMLELIDNFDALGIKGGAIVVDGQVAAFSFGERLGEDMAHILIEKGDTSYPGIYPMINREFLVHQWSDTQYVNREEDMGLEGLRKSKLSYHPAFLNKTFAARKNG